MSKILQFASVLFLALGGLAALGGVVLLLTLGPRQTGGESERLLAVAVGMFFAGVVYLLVGAVGLAGYANPGSSVLVTALGLVLLAAHFGAVLKALVDGAFRLLALAGLVLPVLYLIGGGQLAGRNREKSGPGR